jgi:peptidoglycan/LPS O-acetylase OafA/YrhL
MTIERKKTVFDFAVSRGARLMPAFLAALLLATAILIVRPMPPLETPTPRQFLANVTMAPSLFGETEVDLPYWTLTYELVFYVSMALALRLGLLRSIEGVGLLVVAVGCLFWATVDVQLHRRGAILLLVQYSNFFLIGICLYRLHRGMARPTTYLALVCAIAVTALGGGERSFHTPGYVYLPLTAAFAGLVWLAVSRYGAWFTWLPLVFLGRISYPLYLVHAVVGYQVIRIGVEQGCTTLVGVIAATFVSVAAAVALHFLVERPGQRWFRALTKKPAEPALLRPPS